MGVKTPKNLEIPPIDPLDISDDLKQWLRIFSENVAFFLRQSRSDAVEVSSGEWYYLAGGSEGVDGSWRFGISSTDAVLQKRVSGTWTTHHQWEFTDA